MYHDVRVREVDGGWFVIEERHTPKGPWVKIGEAFGQRRADLFAAVCRG